jgi:cellulose synthase/poly-beta-1,6-N-acetylglucosamine synthase-like glycosyltransferase
MPVRDESAFIRSSLGGILDQDYPADRTEVLIVDGMSEDGTREVIKEILDQRQRVNVRILDNPQLSVPHALNIGLQHARGEFIFRLDGHSEMAPNYLRSCVTRLREQSDVGCVGGPSVAMGHGVIGKAYAIALQSRFGVGGNTFRTLRRESYVDTLAFGGYRKEVFEQVGNFDPSLSRNQDVEFSARLRKAGFRILLINSTYTLYHAPSSLLPLIKQGFNNGYWNTKMLNKMIHVLSWRHFIPGLFVAALVLTSILALVLPWSASLLLLLLGFYLAASLLASVASAFDHKTPNALLLLLLFPAMHMSYGIGSLCGLGRYLTVRSGS